MKKPITKINPFIETRQHHESELAEDYVEIIADLIASKGEARVSDIAEHLGVSHVTVIRTLKRLSEKGCLQSSPINLTKKGAELAKYSKERHLFLLKYLKALGVSEEVAAIDVEGMEHHISAMTMSAFKNHLNILENTK